MNVRDHLIGIQVAPYTRKFENSLFIRPTLGHTFSLGVIRWVKHDRDRLTITFENARSLVSPQLVQEFFEFGVVLEVDMTHWLHHFWVLSGTRIVPEQ
jgi:hypothetical protein